MRRVIGVGLAIAVSMLTVVREAGAQELFYQAYEEGIKAFDAGQLELAARRLQRALELDSAQSRQKRFYGMTFRPYIPEFYLGLIAARQKQYQQAVTYFQRIEKLNLLRKGDKEYDRLIAERTTAQNALTPAPTVADNNPPVKPPPTSPPTAPPVDNGGRGPGSGPPANPPIVARGPDPTPTPPPSPPPAPPPGPVATTGSTGGAAALRAEFDSQLKQRLYEQAWTTAGRMGAAEGKPAYDEARAAIKRDLQGQINSGGLREADRLLEIARRTIKDDADVRRLAQSLGDRRRVSTAERQVLTLLIKGDYRQSIDAAAPLAKEKKASQRLLFYMACSHAGIALLSTEDSASHLQTARELFAQTSTDPGLAAAHARYISPHILETLRAAR